MVQPWFSSPTSMSPGTRTSSNHTSLTSKPPSISSIGRTSTPSRLMSISSIEMPRCFLASGSVRTKVKIQSACWPSVVQVFWPLTTQSSPSRTAVVRSDARSEPASGSENPCAHQMSTFAVFGRNSCFCSSLPNWAITGPIIEALNASGGGQPARCISSYQMWRRRSLHPRPPHSSGQCGTARPASLSTRMRLDDVLLGELAALDDGRADLLRHLGGEEGPHLLAERAVVLRQLQPHPWLLWSVPAVRACIMSCHR